MLSLTDTTALAFIIFLLMIIIIAIISVFYAFFWKIFSKKKLSITGSELLAQMIKESKIKKIIIGQRKKNSLLKSYNKKLNLVIMNDKNNQGSNYLAIYNTLLIFYNLFKIQDGSKNIFRGLRVISYFFILSIIIFFIVIILVIIININIGSQLIYLDSVIQYLSFVGVFFLIITWFLWVSVVEKLREKIIQIAENFFSKDEIKKMKLLTAFKAIVPLSNNFLW